METFNENKTKLKFIEKFNLIFLGISVRLDKDYTSKINDRVQENYDRIILYLECFACEKKSQSKD